MINLAFALKSLIAFSFRLSQRVQCSRSPQGQASQPKGRHRGTGLLWCPGHCHRCCWRCVPLRLAHRHLRCGPQASLPRYHRNLRRSCRCHRPRSFCLGSSLPGLSLGSSCCRCPTGNHSFPLAGSHQADFALYWDWRPSSACESRLASSPLGGSVRSVVQAYQPIWSQNWRALRQSWSFLLRSCQIVATESVGPSWIHWLLLSLLDCLCPTSCPLDWSQGQKLRECSLGDRIPKIRGWVPPR